MSEIVAKWAEMRRKADEIEDIKRKLGRLREKLENVKVNVNRIGSFGRYENVGKVLGNNITSLENQGDLVTLLEEVLNNAADAYHHTEQELSKADVFSIKSEILDVIWDMISGGNIPASVTPYLKMLTSAMTGQDIDGGDIAKATLAAPTSLFAFFADVAESGWKEALKSGFGIDAYMPTGTQAGETFLSYFKTALKKEADEFVDMGSVAKGAGSIAKWAGVIAEGIGEIVDNYEEYASGEISGGRAVAETIIETGVGVILGIGATAAVGAGLAAAGVVAAPAILVAGGAALIVGGANLLLEGITGKDIGEWISDGICGLGESFSKWVFG